MKYFLKILWINLLLISYFVFSYYVFNGWWYSSVGTVVIVFFSYLIWGKDWQKVTGLKMPVSSILKSFGLAIVFLAISYLLLKHIGEKHQIIHQFTSFGNYYHDVFYTLNEEIILGGITLFVLINRLKTNPLLASVGLSIVFSIIHFVFYKWIFLETGIIEIKTLVVLMLIGIIRNNLIITFKHIGYAWALHFGWMAIMFGSNHYWLESKKLLSQVERFNVFIGSLEMLALTGVLAILSIIYLLKQTHSGKITS